MSRKPHPPSSKKKLQNDQSISSSELERAITLTQAEFEQTEFEQDEDDSDSDEVSELTVQAIQDFSELDLKSPLKRAIQAVGFSKPTPIQAQTLPILLEHNTDFLGQAMTGTGKTAAYLIPILQHIKPSKRSLQTLILCPTRELALQVSEHTSRLSQFLDMPILTIYGGTDPMDQLRGIKEGAPIAVATPGRLLEHLRRGTLSLEHLQTVVLDEADQMLSLGFREEVEAILAKCPAKRCKIWMFSATLSRDVRQLSEQWLSDPEQVLLNAAKDLPSTLKQHYFVTQESNKPEILCKLLDMDEPYGIVFCQTKALASDLSSYLAVRGYQVACLHGDKDQAAREQALSDFREHRIQLLVCTDVAARGLDIPEVTHVINFSLPRESDVYLHRVGRTARSGLAGKVLNLISPTQRGQIKHLQEVLGTEILEGQLPTRRDLGNKKMQTLLAHFQSQDPYRAMDLLDEDWHDVLGNISRREIAGRFISMLMPEIFSVEPAGKQLLGYKSKNQSVDEQDNDPDFERVMQEAEARVKSKKSYQKIAPVTKLAQRDRQQDTHRSKRQRPDSGSKIQNNFKRLESLDQEGEGRKYQRPSSEGRSEYKPRSEGRSDSKRSSEGRSDYKPRSEGRSDYKPRSEGRSDFKRSSEGRSDYKPRSEGRSDFKRSSEGRSDYKPRSEGRSDFKRSSEGRSDYKPRSEGRSDFKRSSEGRSDYKPRSEGRSDFKRSSEGRSDYSRGSEGRSDFKRSSEGRSDYKPRSEGRSDFKRSSEGRPDRKSGGRPGTSSSTRTKKPFRPKK